MPLARIVDSTGKDVTVDGAPLFVKISDGTTVAEVLDGATHDCLKVALYDGNQLAEIDTSGNLSAVALCKGHDGSTWYQMRAETDDGSIAAGIKTLLVINLNYVKDGDAWVPMTQP